MGYCAQRGLEVNKCEAQVTAPDPDLGRSLAAAMTPTLTFSPAPL